MGIVVDNTDYKYGNSGGRGPSIIIPNKIIDASEFEILYVGNSEITGSVEFPNLTLVNDHGLDSTFYECTGLTGYISFPVLTSVGYYGLFNTFGGCTGITSINFPRLTSLTYAAMMQAFNGCTGITNVSFPSLTSVEESGLYDAFSGCTNLMEIHFRADAKSNIESDYDYDSKFGATNATIYFDL